MPNLANIKTYVNNIVNGSYADYELAFLIATVLGDEISSDDITDELIEKLNEIRNDCDTIDDDITKLVRDAYESTIPQTHILKKPILLIKAEGAAISQQYFKTLREARNEMKRQYDGLTRDYVENEPNDYIESTHITENEAIVNFIEDTSNVFVIIDLRRAE